MCSLAISLHPLTYLLTHHDLLSVLRCRPLERDSNPDLRPSPTWKHLRPDFLLSRAFGLCFGVCFATRKHFIHNDSFLSMTAAVPGFCLMAFEMMPKPWLEPADKAGDDQLAFPTAQSALVVIGRDRRSDHKKPYRVQIAYLWSGVEARD